MSRSAPNAAPISMRPSPRATAAWLAAIVAGFALASRVFSVGGGPVLWPFTDAFEYASMAHWMIAGEGPVLRIGPAFLPARVPPVLSVLLLPQAWLDGDPRRFWMTVFAFGVAVLVATFRLAEALGLGRGAALVAAGFVATSPCVAAYAGFVMSDVPALAAWLAVCACALRLARRDGAAPAALLAGAFAAGLFVAFRVTNAAWLLPLAVALPAAAWRGMLRRPAWLAAAVGLAALPLVALAIHQAQTFGSPVATGYAYWLDETRFFAWRRAGRGLAFYAAQLAGLRSELLGRPLGIVGDLYAAPVALLGAFGLLRMRGAPGVDAPARRVLAAVAAGALLVVAVHLCFRWREGRFLLPLVPFVAIGAAFALEALGARLGSQGPVVLSIWGVVMSAMLALTPRPQPGELVASLGRELPRIEASRVRGDAEIEATRLPLALAALFAPRTAVLVPSCKEPIGRDVQLELIRRLALRPLRIDPGQEAVWAALPRWKEDRCTRRSPSNARGMRRGSR